MVANVTFFARLVAADINPDNIAEALVRSSQIGVGTQFVVNGQAYLVIACDFKTQGYTCSDYERKMLASIKLSDFVGNSGHLRFNTTSNKTPLSDALGLGFKEISAPDFLSDLDLFIHSRFPECGASLVLAAKKIEPLELRQAEKEDRKIVVDSKDVAA